MSELADVGEVGEVSRTFTHGHDFGDGVVARQQPGDLVELLMGVGGESGGGGDEAEQAVEEALGVREERAGQFS